MSTEPSMIHSFDNKKPATAAPMSLTIVLSIIAVAVLLGIGTGFGIASFNNSPTTTSKDGKNTSESNSDSKTSAGVKDTKTFPDEAEGTLREGGFEGEGSFHLERPGGESQNVYLTSTTVDLSLFLGKKVRLWGQTFQSEKAGWLMDVGYIELM